MSESPEMIDQCALERASRPQNPVGDHRETIGKEGTMPAESTPEEKNVESQGEERRQYQRVALKTSVHLTSESNFYTGFMNDLSEGGLFVATHNVLPRGSLMEVEFSLPDEQDPIKVRGEVRWVVEYNPSSDGHPGMGIQFTDLPERDRTRIEQFVRLRGGTIFYDD